MDTARKHEIGYQILLHNFVTEIQEEENVGIFIYHADLIISAPQDCLNDTSDYIDPLSRGIINEFFSGVVNDLLPYTDISDNELSDFSVDLIRDIREMLAHSLRCPECGSCDNFAYRETYIQCNSCGEQFVF